MGFERWIDDPARRTMANHVREALRSLGAVVTGAVVRKQFDKRRGTNT